MDYATSKNTGTTHIVVRETLGAVAHFACGGWNYLIHLRRGGSGQVCAECQKAAEEMQDERKTNYRTNC